MPTRKPRRRGVRRSGINQYAYCTNDPINAVDPEGLQERALTPQEKAAVEHGIRVLRAEGQTHAAEVIADLLRQGRIVVDDEYLENHNAVSGWGGGKLHLHSTLFPAPIGSNLKGRRRFGVQKRYEGEILLLAGYMLHEHWHSDHQGYMGRHNSAELEREAWGKQIELLEQMLKKRGRYRDILEQAIEEAKKKRAEY